MLYTDKTSVVYSLLGMDRCLFMQAHKERRRAAFDPDA